MLKFGFRKQAYETAMSKGTSIVRVDDMPYLTNRLMTEGTSFEIAPLENGVYMVTIKRKAEQKTA